MEVTKLLSIVVDNRPGALAEVSRLLGSANINIDAIMGEGLAEMGIIRVITADQESAEKILKKNNFKIIDLNVIALDVPDRPGVLAKISDEMSKRKINIDFMYQVKASEGTARLYIKPDNMDRAIKFLGNVTFV